ncbi:MAG: hypothetical protein IKH88_01260, partial [Prevotella sp.]|nr:hypothetical protein [Prevotella sp.]
NMNAELRNTDAGQAKALSNAFGDIKEKIGAMVAPFESTLMYVGQFSLAINSIATTATGIWGVIKSVRALAVSVGLSNMVTKAHNVTLIAFRTVTTWAAAATTTLGAALRTLLISSGVGVVIVGLGMAINALMGSSKDAADGLDDMSEAERNAQAAAEAERAEVERSTAQLHQHIAICKNFKGTKEEEKKVVDMLNNTYGSTMGYFSSVSAWYKTLVANSKAYAQQMIIEARARQIANQIAKLDAEEHALRYNDDGSLKMYSTVDEDKEKVTHTGTSIWGPYSYETFETVPGTSPWDKVAGKIQSIGKQRANWQKQLENLLASTPDMPVHGSPGQSSLCGFAVSPCSFLPFDRNPSHLCYIPYECM